MPARPDDDRLRRWRLAAQRLTPVTRAPDVRDAVRSVVGVQAQDLRAASLALRSRVEGLLRSAVEGSGLVRTWTVRGTVHLIDQDDLPWLHAVTGPRNRRRFDALMAKRGSLQLAQAMLPDIVAVLEQGPRDRAGLLAELAARGQPDLGPRSVNIIAPWAAAQGLVRGLPDGRLTAADPPPRADADEAMATLAQRYLAGYGPASDADLARWSGLPLRAARRALAAVSEIETAGDLVALPGTFDAAAPAPPPALLLAAFDTLMLGYATREPFLAAAEDHRILPGGGMLRAAVLARGRVTGTWRVTGAGGKRILAVEWFGRRAPAQALGAEALDVGRFLGVDVRVEG